jgi:lipopolysaccharide transport system ATP-binding protein
MSDVIISVENLGKKYPIQHQQQRQRSNYKTLRETITQKARHLVTGWNRRGPEAAKAKTREDFWALRNVSFDLKRGHVLGIIGRNGAGKSTLLKVLSRITEPSEGRVTLRGRVASLLEVGTGFHPELTGRENIFLNGSILGMTRAEIKRKFDEIVAFAGVEKFLDTPVKRYSSGMYVRLAFAVAAHLEPEILVVDEVLAVGDAEFQKKCLDKMGQVARGGRTVLFVSHQLASVRAMCDTVIWMDRGTLKQAGAPATTISNYLSQSLSLDATKIVQNNGCVLESAAIAGDGDNVTGALIAGDPWSVCVRYRLTNDLQTGVSLRISTIQGSVVADLHECVRGGNVRQAGDYETTFDMSKVNLAPGSYLLSVFLMVHQGPQHLIADPYARFEVIGTMSGFDGTRWPYDIGGVLYVEPSVNTISIQ